MLILMCTIRLKLMCNVTNLFDCITAIINTSGGLNKLFEVSKKKKSTSRI